MTQHMREEEETRSWENSATGEETQTYRMALPTKGGLWSFSVEGCTGRAATRTAMRVHFIHRHVLDTVFILEEVNLSHPRCHQCNMLSPWFTLNGRHPTTAQCASGEEQKRRYLAEAELRESTERAFWAYGEPLENVSEFKYLIWVMTAVDDDWPAVVGNFCKARKIWERLSQILSREGADPKVLGHSF